MLDLVWVALAVGVLASIGGAVQATRAGLRGWRAFRGTSGRITDGLTTVGIAGAAAAEHAGAAAEGSARIGEAAERLERSLAELAVLRRAATRTTAGLTSARGLLRK